jgi:FkbM family methyltransferase
MKLKNMSNSSIRKIIKPAIYKLLGTRAYKWFYFKAKSKDIQNGNFLEPETALLKEFIKQGDEVIDIGANYGHLSILFARLSAPGTVYAFEPIPFTYQINKKILKKFKTDNVKLFNMGVGNEAEEKEFKVPLLDFGGLDTGLAFISTRTFLEHEKFNTYKIQVVKPDEFLFSRLKNLKFVKIDIEGAEFFALKGMEKIIKKHKPVLMIEICPDYLKGFNVDLHEFEDYIRNELHYDMFTYSAETKKLIPQMGLMDSYYIMIQKDTVNNFSYLI